jgi:hypothetical protein
MSMTPSVKVQLNPLERNALEKMASQNYRRPSEELRFLVVQEAKRRGLLHDPPDCQQMPTKNEGHAVVIEAAGAPFCVQP